MVGERGELIPHVLVKQVPSSQANERKQYGLQGFIRRNQQEPLVVLWSLPDVGGWRTGHDSLRPWDIGRMSTCFYGK